MTRLVPLFAILLPLSAFAQDPAALDATDPLAWVRLLFEAVRSGRWPEVGAILLVLTVVVVRKFGLKARDLLPDHTLADRALAFLFDSKPGGWLLNIATALAGGMSGALLAGQAIDLALLKSVVPVSLIGAAMWEAAKDGADWYYGRGPAPLVVAATAGAQAGEAAGTRAASSDEAAAKELGDLPGGGGK